MNKTFNSLAALLPFVFACGASMPPPTQRMADAESAERSALELGASNVPTAKLSLKLAREQIALAKRAMDEGENERADSLLIRAKADAELAIAQAREKSAQADTQNAREDSDAQKATNAGQGAVK